MNKKAYKKPAMQLFAVQQAQPIAGSSALSADFMSGPGISGSRGSHHYDVWKYDEEDEDY